MSLAIVVYVPAGIVMASDSRQSIIIETKNPQGEVVNVETVNSDTVNKTFLLERPPTGLSSFGADMLNSRPIAGHLRSFIEEEVTRADDVETLSQKLHAYFRERFPTANIGFHLAGYKREGRRNIPHVYYCHVADELVKRRNINDDGSISFGVCWSGITDVLDSILNPLTITDESGKEKIVRRVAPIVWDVMALQDAIDFAIYAIRTTIDTIRFQARSKNVGGPIDVLVLTRDEAKWILKKELHS
jgi:hypothetical protein